MRDFLKGFRDGLIIGLLLVVATVFLTIACSDNDTFVTQPIYQDTIIVYPHLPPPDCDTTFVFPHCSGLAKQLIELKRELKECRDGGE